MNVPRHQLDAIRAGATQTALLPRPHAVIDGQTITLRTRGLGDRRGDPVRQPKPCPTKTRRRTE